MNTIPSNKVTEVATLLNTLAMIDKKIAEIKKITSDVENKLDFDVRTRNAAGATSPFMDVNSDELIDVMNNRKTIVLEQLAEHGIEVKEE